MRAGVGVRDSGKKATRLQMRVLIGIGSREYRATGYAMRLEMVHHFGWCALARPGCQSLIEFVLVLQTTSRRQQMCLGRPVWLSERCTQALPLRIIGHGNGDPGALASTRIDVVRCHTGMVIAQRAGITLVHLRIQEKLSQVGQHVLGLRKLNELSLASSLAVKQGCQQCQGRARATRSVHMHDRWHLEALDIVRVTAYRRKAT